MLWNVLYKEFRQLANVVVALASVLLVTSDDESLEIALDSVLVAFVLDASDDLIPIAWARLIEGFLAM